MSRGPASSPGRAAGRAARVLRDERGQATVETAFGIASLAAVLLTAVSALAAVAAHLAAVDAAAQLARAEGRGDRAAAAVIADRLGDGWSTSTRRDGDLVVAVVEKDLALLDVRAEAAALAEEP
ncbi:TadE family type IV pilus minor pilin [Corynebacterium sp. 335C]